MDIPFHGEHTWDHVLDCRLGRRLRRYLERYLARCIGRHLGAASGDIGARYRAPSGRGIERYWGALSSASLGVASALM